MRAAGTGGRAGLRSSFLAAALLLVAAPMGAADHGEPVELAVFDLFWDLHPGDLQFVPGCSAGAFSDIVAAEFVVDPDGDWFRFEEGETSVAGAPLNDGLTRTVCGQARVTFDVPPGTDHIHVRFDGDRDIRGVTVDLDPDTPNLQTFLQEVWVETPDGQLLPNADGDSVHDVYTFSEGSSGREFHDLPLWPVPSGATNLTAVWYFEDQGQLLPQDFPNVLSGQTVRATVWWPQIEISGVPIEDWSTHEDVRFQDASLRQELRVEARMPPAFTSAYHAEIRFRVDGNFTMDHVVLPEGERYDQLGSYTTGNRPTWDKQGIIIEPRAGSFLQVTLPGRIVDDAGSGTYTFVFWQPHTEAPQPVLLGLSLLLLILPVIFAAIAFIQVRRFHREAFGHFRASARNLLGAVVLVFAYYVAVILTSWSIGWTDLMAVTPIVTQVWIMYLQVALVIAAFTAILFASNHLSAITRPDD